MPFVFRFFLKKPASYTLTVVASGDVQELFEPGIQLTTEADDVVSSRPMNHAIFSVFFLYLGVRYLIQQKTGENANL
jgi:hypothetical protein